MQFCHIYRNANATAMKEEEMGDDRRSVSRIRVIDVSK